MGVRARWLLGTLAWLVAIACTGAGTEREVEATTDLAPGVVASVTGSQVHADTIAQIARAQGVSIEQAADRAIGDALLAVHSEPHRSVAERAASARALLSELRREAERDGVPDPAEVATALERRWWEIDRPEMRRSLHVVVVLEDGTDREAARKHAEKIYDSVKDAPNGIEFRKRVNAIDKAGFRVELQDLLPVAPDGRALEVKRYQPPGTRHSTYHREYAAPLFQLKKLNQITPLFETPSGFHVAMLLQIIEQQRLGDEELRAVLHDDIYQARTQSRVQSLLENAKQQTPPEISLDAVNLMGLTLVSAEPQPNPPPPEVR